MRVTSKDTKCDNHVSNVSCVLSNTSISSFWLWFNRALTKEMDDSTGSIVYRKNKSDLKEVLDCVSRYLQWSLLGASSISTVYSRRSESIQDQAKDTSRDFHSNHEGPSQHGVQSVLKIFQDKCEGRISTLDANLALHQQNARVAFFINVKVTLPLKTRTSVKVMFQL